MTTQGETNIFYELMVKNLDFFVCYLSVHFPFTEKEINDYWDVLDRGTAHYTVFLESTEAVYKPSPGLCFNQNIRWTKTLRDKWKVGFDDPYNGYFVGVGDEPIEYDDDERLKALLPFNISKEWDAADMGYMDQANRWGDLENFVESQFSDEAKKLEQEYLAETRHKFPELESLFLRNSSLFLCSRSIWYNTLYYEISENEVFSLLRLKGIP